MRHTDHPSFPSVMTCCFFRSLKTLLMPREPIRVLLRVNVLGFSCGRFWVTPDGKAELMLAVVTFSLL